MLLYFPLTFPAQNIAPGEGRLDGEALDLHYRCQFVASNEGELSLTLPRDEAWQPPATRSDDVIEEESIPKVVLDARDMRVRREGAQWR